MTTTTTTIMTCDSCGRKEEFKSYDLGRPAYWVEIELNGSYTSNEGTTIHLLDLCPTCQVKILVALDIEVA